MALTLCHMETDSCMKYFSSCPGAGVYLIVQLSLRRHLSEIGTNFGDLPFFRNEKSSSRVGFCRQLLKSYDKDKLSLLFYFYFGFFDHIRHVDISCAQFDRLIPSISALTRQLLVSTITNGAWEEQHIFSSALSLHLTAVNPTTTLDSCRVCSPSAPAAHSHSPPASLCLLLNSYSPFLCKCSMPRGTAVSALCKWHRDD